MEFAFSEEQQELAADGAVAADEARGQRRRPGRVESEGYDEALWQTLCEQIGVAALGIPEEYDGAGFSLFESLIVLEEVGRSLAPSPLLSSLVTAEALLAGADEEAKRRLLPRIAAGEPAAFVTGAGPVLDGDRATVLVAADRRRPGRGRRRRRRPATWAESMDQTIRLAHVDLTDGHDDAHRRRGRGASTGPSCVGAVGVTALQAGLAARALEMTVAYSKERVQFGRPIGSFQALKHRMADMLVLLEMSRSASWAASYAVVPVAPTTRRELDARRQVLLRRRAGPDRRRDVQLHGGIAITWEHDAHLVFKRAHALGQLSGRRATTAVRSACHPAQAE